MPLFNRHSRIRSWRSQPCQFGKRVRTHASSATNHGELSMKFRLAILAALLATTISADAQTKKEVIPHAQTKPPGPALSPQEALKKMQVPPGFRVELVAAEPDLINPVAMTFDERGRIWVTESIEYPRRSAGPGKDRVKVLES